MGVSAHNSRQSGGQWPGSFVLATVCLLAASTYLCLSIAQAIQPHASRLAETTLPTFAPPWNVVATDSTGVQPASANTMANQHGDVSPELLAIPGIPSESLRRAVLSGAGEDVDHLAVSVKRLSDGLTASVNGDVLYYAASTFKLAILYEAALRHSRDEISFDDRLFISDADAAEDLGTSGFLHFEDDGSITIRNLLQAMIVVSDNSSAVTLLHAFGAGTVDETLRALEVSKMTVNSEELWTTADDLARLMEVIYAGQGVRIEDRDFMRDLLVHQSIRTGIPAALADEAKDGLRIGNKTGTWGAAQHDVAFIEAPDGVYVLSVLTDGSYEGWGALHRVTQTVHQALNNRP